MGLSLFYRRGQEGIHREKGDFILTPFRILLFKQPILLDRVHKSSPRTIIMFRFVLLCFLALPFGKNLSAQKLLAVENPYALKREIYQPGDILTFKSEGNKRWFEGMIETVYDSSVIIVKQVVYADGENQRKDLVKNQIPFREITHVKYNGRSKFNGFKKVFGVSSLLAGAYLLGVTLVNVITTPENERTVDETSLYIAGGFAGAGAILLATAKNKHKMGKRWRIRAMLPMTPGEELVPGSR